MSRIRGRDTTPEMVVRSTLHAMGYRFRLHDRNLPGSPDLVFPGRRKVIFVHGCFWHRHRCRFGNVMPRTRRKFWEAKLNGNKERDRRNRHLLRNQGWEVFVVWECHVGQPTRMVDRLVAFLDNPR